METPNNDELLKPYQVQREREMVFAALVMEPRSKWFWHRSPRRLLPIGIGSVILLCSFVGIINLANSEGLPHEVEVAQQVSNKTPEPERNIAPLKTTEFSEKNSPVATAKPLEQSLEQTAKPKVADANKPSKDSILPNKPPISGEKPVTEPKTEAVVLGNNRDSELDSRVFPTLEVELVEGVFAYVVQVKRDGKFISVGTFTRLPASGSTTVTLNIKVPKNSTLEYRFVLHFRDGSSKQLDPQTKEIK